MPQPLFDPIVRDIGTSTTTTAQQQRYDVALVSHPVKIINGLPFLESCIVLTHCHANFRHSGKVNSSTVILFLCGSGREDGDRGDLQEHILKKNQHHAGWGKGVTLYLRRLVRGFIT